MILSFISCLPSYFMGYPIYRLNHYSLNILYWWASVCSTDLAKKCLLPVSQAYRLSGEDVGGSSNTSDIDQQTEEHALFHIPVSPNCILICRALDASVHVTACALRSDPMYEWPVHMENIHALLITILTQTSFFNIFVDHFSHAQQLPPLLHTFQSHRSHPRMLL